MPAEQELLQLAKSTLKAEAGDVAPRWASKMREVLAGLLPNKFTPETLGTTLEEGARSGKFTTSEYNDAMRLTNLSDLVTTRKKVLDKASVLEQLDEKGISVDEQVLQGQTGPSKTRYPAYKLPEGEDYTEVVLRSPQAKPFDDPHFKGKKNIGHFRGQTFHDNEGRKIFNIEEIQSDRHAEGRREGYQQPRSARAKAIYRQLNKEYQAALDEHNSLIRQLADVEALSGKPTEASSLIREKLSKSWPVLEDAMEKRQAAELARSGAPDAPFRKKWQQLVLRRALKHAAETGHEGVSWTTGEQQNARYSLGRVLKDIIWTPSTEKEGWGNLTYTTSEFSEPRNIHLPQERLGDNVGHGLAEYLKAHPGTIVSDFAIGGEGKKRLYGSAEEGGWNYKGKKSVIASAMRDAAKPFKLSESSINKDIPEFAIRLGEAQEWSGDEARRGYEIFNTRTGKAVEYFPWPTDDQGHLRSRPRQVLLQVKKAALERVKQLNESVPGYSEHKAGKYSRQPGFYLTPEMKEKWSKNPMYLYSILPALISGIAGARAMQSRER